MKLYHIDRIGHLKPNTILELAQANNENYKEGFSTHGVRMYLSASNSKDHTIEAVFEHERQMHFPDKICRYQAFYAFEKEAIIEFFEAKQLHREFYKIYEIEAEHYSKHDMSLVRGLSLYEISKYAKRYWNQEQDKKPIFEYLVKYPIKIGKEISYEELKKIN